MTRHKHFGSGSVDDAHECWCRACGPGGLIAMTCGGGRCFACSLPAAAQVKWGGRSPYLGWMQLQANRSGGQFPNSQWWRSRCASRPRVCQRHGLNYINGLGLGWAAFDAYGRPNSQSGDLSRHRRACRARHANGQKLGILLDPGVNRPAWMPLADPGHALPHPGHPGRPQYAGPMHSARASFRPNHNKIDFNQPGAQAYMGLGSRPGLPAWGGGFHSWTGLLPGSYND